MVQHVQVSVRSTNVCSFMLNRLIHRPLVYLQQSAASVMMYSAATSARMSMLVDLKKIVAYGSNISFSRTSVAQCCASPTCCCSCSKSPLLCSTTWAICSLTGSDNCELMRAWASTAVLLSRCIRRASCMTAGQQGVTNTLGSDRGRVCHAHTAAATSMHWEIASRG